MATTSTQQTGVVFSPEVLAFARANGIDGMLEPLAEITQRLFPTGMLRVWHQPDLELPGHSYLKFEVTVPRQDIGDYVAAHTNWIKEYLKVRQMPDKCLIVMSLVTSES